MQICCPLERNDSVGHCGRAEAYYRWISISDLAINVVILIIPLPILWSLETRDGSKTRLTFDVPDPLHVISWKHPE